MAVAPPPPPCQGELLHNGICLPAQFPPRGGANLSDRAVRPPPYVIDPPKAINVSLGRQLLAVDSFLVANVSGAVRVWHAAEYDDRSPVLSPSGPWEGTIAMPFSGGAWYDEQTRQFRLWYSCGPAKNRTCLAVSADGVSWSKPPQPAAVHPGTNVVRDIEHYDTNVVWLDHSERNASRRWKMSEAACTYCSHSYGLLSSADGIAWEVEVQRTGYVPDRSTIYYDPFRSKWVFSIKSAVKHHGQGRCRAYWESTDLLDAKQCNWTHNSTWEGECYYDRGKRVSCGEGIPLPWVGTDDGEPHLAPPLSNKPSQFRPQLYNLDVVAYESVLVGLFTILQCKHSDAPTECPGPNEGHSNNSTEFNSVFVGFSRDGWHWSRSDVPRRPLAGLSADPRAWNYEDVQSTGGGFFVLQDSLRFLLSGRRAGMTEDQTGAATLRRDGFASLKTSGTATILTRPLVWDAELDNLFVNFQGSRIRVAVVNLEGRPLPHLATEDCVGFAGDSTRAAIKWKRAEGLGKVGERGVRLLFTLEQGQLFSFWLSSSKSCGASRGYLAAGGPSASGGRDLTGFCSHEG